MPQDQQHSTEEIAAMVGHGTRKQAHSLERRLCYLGDHDVADSQYYVQIRLIGCPPYAVCFDYANQHPPRN